MPSPEHETLLTSNKGVVELNCTVTVESPLIFKPVIVDEYIVVGKDSLDMVLVGLLGGERFLNGSLSKSEGIILIFHIYYIYEIILSCKNWEGKFTYYNGVVKGAI